MSEFKAEQFMEKPDQDVFESLRKADLILLAQFLKVPAKTSMRKVEIQYNVAKCLVELEKFDESVLKRYVSESAEIELKKLEIQAQLELKKLEMEEKRQEREERERERERETGKIRRQTGKVRRAREAGKVSRERKAGQIRRTTLTLRNEKVRVKY